MCYYRYVYYGACSHAELYRSSYCDKARERQQTYATHPVSRPLNHHSPYHSDDLYGRSSGTDNTHAGKPSPDPASGSLAHYQQQPPSAASHRHNNHSMSTATPSEIGTAFSWVDIASEPDTDALRQADLIPRSVQPDQDVPTPNQQGSSRKNHPHRASKSSPASEIAGYDKLNINIPLSPYASGSLSTRFTHEQGKVQEIIARFESCADGKHSIATLLTHHAQATTMYAIVITILTRTPKRSEPSLLQTIASINRV
jgi:hypothetical protein